MRGVLNRKGLSFFAARQRRAKAKAKCVLRKKNSLFRRSLRGAASSGDLRLVFAVDALRYPFVPLQDLRASGGALFGGKNAAAFLGGFLCPFGRGASFFGVLPFDGGSGQGRERGEQIEQTEFFHARAPRKKFALFSCDLRRAVSSFGSCGAIKTGKEGGIVKFSSYFNFFCLLKRPF